MNRWGIDLGGTKIEGVILDSELRPLIRHRIPTGQEQGYGHILMQIKSLVGTMAEKSGLGLPEKIGIGTPGRADGSDGVISNSNTICLNGMPLLRDLQEALRLEVVIDNDANCFALAESMLGAGRDEMARPGATAFGIILGTGVGGGIVRDGRIIRGAHGIAGEWGHNPLPGEHAACYCGRRGCVETVVSGPALERHYAALSGRKASLQEIAASTGRDRFARQTIERLVSKFGVALATVINILDPDLVIIGGGVGNIRQLYSPEARQAIAANVFNRSFDIPLLPPMLGDSAGVFGAALLSGPPLIAQY
ncbi:MAG TPA: sugar kinase [Chlorobaculum sp.]|uniref:ROK family protein n=1 Tax=Chlorobaculum tepidum (strain ATCC 49652 / DSM 12025 / NBRC 103806 / TLS) TaxID=194439 RepID=Q8KGG0_CHLTE|nr:ROK family protein [Chlorobaculum tepidum]AAM71256.1 ROK family protein [Chlorobaculum tepidum TLS]HBU24265.1 sugar kinase [Chlorobaculum sp.]